ncbi:MAG: hypothetical protein ACPHF3_06540 [Pseudomonadales bacterium]
MRTMIKMIALNLCFAGQMALADGLSAFDQMKQMAGSWQGTLTRSTGEVVETRSNFRVISDGHTMIETLIEDGVEMLTTYSEQDGELQVTHYCSLGTEPKFKTTGSSDGIIDLRLIADSGLHEAHHNFVASMNYDLSDIAAGSVVVSNTVMNGGARESGRAVIKRVE